jgi:hypothetical protein
MKKLALTALLLAGCATTNVATPGRDAKVKELAAKGQAIANRAKQCMAAALKRGRTDKDETTASDSSTKGGTQIASDVSKCKAAEARENEELLSQEGSEYVLEGEQERDRATLIMILTTSRSH